MKPTLTQIEAAAEIVYQVLTPTPQYQLAVVVQAPWDECLG